jgi:hypothetical protein
LGRSDRSTTRVFAKEKAGEDDPPAANSFKEGR